ncbi:hypothetical protein RFI_07842 [Reticulomyxa filosa]|uniref:Uncharacterized protein n=1 Tax=Reticulomyxa filosa TaxID=46433 RepID=X6NU14_RETFI|nr:hypothetical protein RFI_07842 [Reticulomyxa filosa]|eukprot:ETO29279.1 hypothetical protein RFI_07842 [Reticulomyxa filosa]
MRTDCLNVSHQVILEASTKMLSKKLLLCVWEHRHINNRLTVRVYVDDGKKKRKKDCDYFDLHLKELNYDGLVQQIEKKILRKKNSDDPSDPNWEIVTFKEAKEDLRDTSADVTICNDVGLEDEILDYGGEDDSDSDNNERVSKKQIAIILLVKTLGTI